MNTKKISLNLISLVLILVLVLGSVNAKEDFKASTNKYVGLCPCSNQAYGIVVQNIGSVQNSYTIVASGEAADWVSFSPDKLTLIPRQKGKFSVIVNSACNIGGDYDLEIFITPDGGLTRVIKQTLKFSQCYDYSLQQGQVVEEIGESIGFLQQDGIYSLCKDGRKSIPVLITNNENFQNKYKLFLDAPEWAGLNTYSVSLGAKKSGVFLINLDLADVEGEFDFKLDAVSELGKVQRKNNIEVNVQDCYALEIDLKGEDTVCGGEERSYDVSIKNPVDFGKNIKLFLDAPEWASFGNNTSLYLKSEKEKDAILNINPNEEISGNFLVKVSALVENKATFEDQINIEVIPKFSCYKADISTRTSITNFYSKEFYPAKIRNDGIKETNYDVGLEGPSWVRATPKTFELNPGQTGNLNLIVNPGNDIEPGTYGLKINLESNDIIYSKNVDIVLKEENRFVKELKADIMFYKYYIYLLILIIIFIIISVKQIIRIKNKIKKDYEKHKVKEERLRALKLARKEREEEKGKKKELEEKEKEEERKKELEKKKKEKNGKPPFKKIYIGKVLVYVIIFIATIVFVGHQNGLFNVKYLHIYIRNLFYGYLYYILIGLGVVIVLFLLLLLYNLISRKRKRKKMAESKKAEKGIKKGKRWRNKPSYAIAIFVPIMIMLAALTYLNLFDDIGDFVILYSYYFGFGIAILVAIILLIRFYKPLFKFLRE